jgi:hypothetical protein
VTLDRESLRCLKYIIKGGADLEEPLKNSSLHFLLDRGMIKVARRYQSRWGHRMHNCVRLEATPHGQQVFDQQTPGA